MASSSTSSSNNTFKYDVFLSFRGEDTRKNFVDHLYFALRLKNIRVYKDDERIKKGKRITDELVKSIEDSQLYIIVFSKNYTSSSWCLDELVKIMECQRLATRIAYPIFYDVEPFEVRKQCGAVGRAFAKHKMEESGSNIKWIEALREAADLAGWELNKTVDGYEAKFIQKVVEEISQDLRCINSTGNGKMIGMETEENDVVSSLENGVEVCTRRNKWINDSLKTTMGKAVVNSFVDNVVKEVSKASLTGLKMLQKQVRPDALDNREKIMKRMFGRKNHDHYDKCVK